MIRELVGGLAPIVLPNKVVSVPREQLPGEYADLVAKNPLLARIEGTAKTINWTDLEVRTLQLVAAVASNASLQKRVKDLEVELDAKKTHSPRG